MRHTPCGYRVRPPSQSRLTPCQLPHRAVPRLANSDTICYNTPKRCSGGGWPLLSREEAMLLKASSYPVARR